MSLADYQVVRTGANKDTIAAWSLKYNNLLDATGGSGLEIIGTTVDITDDTAYTGFVYFSPNGILNIASGKVVTFASPEHILASPRQQIFSGAGTVAFTKPGFVTPNYWATNTTPGTTDMSAAIQHAVTATGMVEWLPETYLSDDSAFSDNVWLRGNGWQSIIKIKDSTNTWLFQRSGTSSTSHFKAENFAIDGNKANNTGAGGFLVVGENIEITGIYAYDCGYPAIYIGDNLATACKGVRIHHNLIDNSGKDDGWGAIAVVSGTDIDIDHNIILSTDNEMFYAIDVEPNQDGTYEWITISDNICKGRISADFGNSATPGKHISIHDNLVDVHGYTGTSKEYILPIYVRNAEDVDVHDNDCVGNPAATGTNTYGAFLVGLTRFNVSDNKFKGYDLTPANEYGVNFVDSISGNGTIEGNQFYAVSGTLTYGVYSYNMLENSIIQNNIGSGVTYPELISASNPATNVNPKSGANGGYFYIGMGFGDAVYQKQTWAAAAPTTGDWLVGDVCWNTGAAAGGSPGWVCTTAGTPGTWKAMGVVGA